MTACQLEAMKSTRDSRQQTSRVIRLSKVKSSSSQQPMNQVIDEADAVIAFCNTFIATAQSRMTMYSSLNLSISVYKGPNIDFSANKAQTAGLVTSFWKSILRDSGKIKRETSTRCQHAK